jgi:hypothetical protein
MSQVREDSDAEIVQSDGEAPESKQKKPRKKRPRTATAKKNHRERQKVAKKATKATVEGVFNDLVMHIASTLPRNHHEGTDSNELDLFCREHFPHQFKGVFAANTHPADMSNGFYIINTDPFKLPGEHWTAVADGLFYDSFDRKSTKLFPEVLLKGTGKNRNTAQRATESNCGERCLAFFVCYNEFGRAACEKYL